MPNAALLRHPRLREPVTAAERGSGHRAPGGRRPGLGYGCDYNPEQWDEDVWAEDAHLMHEAGVTFVTVGVFAWGHIEASPGERNLGWLDRVLDLMDSHDIGVDLATATASTPAWLVQAHPDVLPVDREGRRLGFGSRQAWCPSSPVYRERSLSLVEDLATRYAGHPALAMWHVSNELGDHNGACYCDVSAASFRRWLQSRYGDLAELNHAWGTSFWSQEYSDWDQIGTPRITTAIVNPTQELDFRRFCSDELLEQHRAETAVLHRITPEIPVTTNFMVTSQTDALDYWRWAPEQDVISTDHYLLGHLDDPQVDLAMCADWTRGIAGGSPWVLMEHSTSAVNWQQRNYAKTPGQMQRNTLQHVARGADSVGFFQWRASRAGAEKYHSAMLPHAGTDSRVWREVVELGRVLERLGEVAGTMPRARVALLLDFECWWAVQRGALPVAGLDYWDRARALYRALWDRGVTVDVRHPGQAHDAYSVVLAPMLHLVRDEDAARLTAYVRAGGHLLTTYFSGIVDEHDHVRLGGYPGAFRELLGIRVEEFVPLEPSATVQLGGAVAGTADAWIEDLHLAGATAVSHLLDGPLPGTPTFTRHDEGSGVAWYLATRTDEVTTAAVLDHVLGEAGLDGGPGNPGVEVVRRVGEGRSYAFVVNHTEVGVDLAISGHDLVADVRHDSGIRVPAGGVACVREGAP